jgi:tRNA(Leu) C34 or U34 (ribose-2'-O)-methylase TrmL
MKTTLTLFFFTLLFQVQAQMKNLYVAYSTGINIRESAALNAKVLIKIPYGTKLNIDYYTRAGKEEIVENMTGKWAEVTYLSQITKKFGAELAFNHLVSNQPIEESTKQTKQLYVNGVAKHHLAATEYFSDTYYLPYLSMQEVFVLLRQIDEFKTIFTEKDAYYIANAKVKRKLETGDGEIEIKVEKDKYAVSNEVSKIIVAYEQGALYHFEMFMFEGHIVVNFNSGL